MLGRRAVFIYAPHKAKILRNVAVEDDAADRDAHDLAAHGAVRQLLRRADENGLMNTDKVVVVGEHCLILIAVNVEVNGGLFLVGQLIVALAGEGKVDALRPEFVVVHLGKRRFQSARR